MWCNAVSLDKKARGRPGGYFYRSVRLDGRAVKQYVGTGPAAELAAKLLGDRRTERAALAAERTRWASVLAALDDLRDWLAILVKSELLLRGYHEHHGGWRPGRRKPRAGSPPSTAA